MVVTYEVGLNKVWMYVHLKLTDAISHHWHYIYTGFWIEYVRDSYTYSSFGASQ